MENMRATDALNAMDFSDLEAQIERLKQKELIIKNETAAKKTLVKASYYSLINGFELPPLSVFTISLEVGDSYEQCMLVPLCSKQRLHFY